MSKLRAKTPNMIIPRKPTIVVYGPPGSGKTWAALDFPRCYFVDTEGGATLPPYVAKLERSGGAYLGPDDGALDFAVVLDQVAALGTEKHEFQTLVIDSFTKLFATEVSREWDRKQRRGENMSATYGAERKPAINLTRQLIRRLDHLDMTTLLICHETAEWQNGQAVGTTHDAWDKLSYELDLVLQIVANGSQRMAKVGKSRLSTFPKGAVLPWFYTEVAKRLASLVDGG